MGTPDSSYIAQLQDYYARHHCIPAYERLRTLWSLASRSSVAKVLDRLRRQDVIERTPDGDWVPTRRFFERMLASQPVRAGHPDADLGAGLTPTLLDDLLVSTPSRTVLITVTGDSMVEANIFDGDVVIVERQHNASVGEIVVALIDGDLTVKRLLQDGQGWYLHPENSGYPDIRPEGELQLVGVVTGLARRLKKSV